MIPVVKYRRQSLSPDWLPCITSHSFKLKKQNNVYIHYYEWFWPKHVKNQYSCDVVGFFLLQLHFLVLLKTIQVAKQTLNLPTETTLSPFLPSLPTSPIMEYASSNLSFKITTIKKKNINHFYSKLWELNPQSLLIFDIQLHQCSVCKWLTSLLWARLKQETNRDTPVLLLGKEDFSDAYSYLWAVHLLSMQSICPTDCVCAAHRDGSQTVAVSVLFPVG